METMWPVCSNSMIRRRSRRAWATVQRRDLRKSKAASVGGETVSSGGHQGRVWCWGNDGIWQRLRRVWRQAKARFGRGWGHVRRRGNGELWRRPRQGQAAGQRSASPSFLWEREGPRRPLAIGEKQLRAIHVFSKRWTRGSVVLEGSVDLAFLENIPLRGPSNPYQSTTKHS
jgi:hypothetical protein